MSVSTTGQDLGASIRRAAVQVQETIARRRYPLPALRTRATRTREPMIYYCIADYNVPAGGIRVGYRHVDLLNEAGIPAAVLHRRSGFRCTWFDNDTRIFSSSETIIEPGDLVVVGELWVELLDDLPPGFRFVVFNQNPHLTWKRATPELVSSYASSPDLAAILTVSDHGVRVLQHASPQARVLRTHNSIDPELFFAGPSPRGRTIAYMPRRGRAEAEQVLGILRARGALQGWSVSAIDGLTEAEVAGELRTATVFLSFAHHEGFGLPAAEAMACGAYVVGFHGFGGVEFFRPEFSAPVPPGDVLSFARAVEETLARQAQEPGWCEARGARAAQFVADEYSPERERADVVGTYASLIADDWG